MERHGISRVIALVVWSICLLPALTGFGESSLIDEAKKEGTVVFYSTMNAEHHGKLVQAFHAKYPFIKIEGFRANPVGVVNRVLTEGRAGRPLEIVQADPVVAWPWGLLLSRVARHPNSGSLFIDSVLSEEGQRYLASLGRTVIRPGIKNRYPQLVEGVKFHPVRPDSGKDYETLSKTYYDIVNAR